MRKSKERRGKPTYEIYVRGFEFFKTRFYAGVEVLTGAAAKVALDHVIGPVV